MIHYIGNIDKDKIDDYTRINRNKVKSWKYGYNEEFDIIIISKDGTLGAVYYVNGIYIGLPEIPKNRKNILNWDKTEKNQRWKRKEIPKGLNAKTQFNEEYKEYITKEIERRKNGVFIYLKGQEIYMPGTSYYFYQWNKLAVGYPTFRIIQNDLMIYWEACKADHRCFGICYVKNRRFGWSSICNAEMLDAGTSNNDKELGIISKTGADAKKMFTRLVRTFKKLPPFFMPVWDGTTTPKKELLLSEPSRKKRIEDEEKLIDEGLDTIIAYFATTLNSMDGDPVFRSALDEVGKFPADCPFDEYWGIVKTSHTVGESITGKSMVGSTVNPMDAGGREFKNIYDDSDPLIRNENDETPSGLYKLFIPAEYGLAGYYDTYGFCIVENPKTPIKNDLGKIKSIGSLTYLKNKFDALKHDLNKYNDEKRKFPSTEREAFRESSDECDFNLSKLLEQIEHNEYELNYDTNGSDDIERGNFTWKDGIQDTEVIWRANPNGRFWIKKGCHPPIEYRNKKEMKMKYGVLSWFPLGYELGSFGVDPYNRSKSADGRGSKGAIHLCTMTNTSELPNDTFILEYIDRPKKVTLFFEDVLMAMVYYSMPMLSELSNEAFLKYIKDRGYRHYSLNNPFKLYKDLNPTEKELGGAPPQNKKIGDIQFTATESYIEDYVGISLDNRIRPIGNMGDMPFNRTLIQWKDVDTEKRTKYDAYISSSLAILGNQRRAKKKIETKKRRNPFRKYDTSGTISVPL